MAHFSNPFAAFGAPADRRRRCSVRFAPEGLEPRLSPSGVPIAQVSSQLNVPEDPIPPPPPPGPPTQPPTGPIGPA